MPRRDEYDNEDDRDQGRHDDDDRPKPRRDDRGYDDGEEGYDDYVGRPRRQSRHEAARQRVFLPAIFLMIVGGLGLGLALLNVVLEALDVGGPNPFANPQKANDPNFQQMEKVMKVVGPILNILWALIVITGAWQMKNLKSRGYVIFSCIYAMVGPCNGCCLLAIPFAIWALVVVNDESVKRAF